MRAPVPFDRMSEPYRRIVCDAPAKINLALHVTGQRPDGYHELDTLVVFCNVGDRISVARAAPGQADRISLHASGPYADDLPPGKDNIAHLAGQTLLESAPELDGDFQLTIDKQLPVASGIGGGSADAAAALIALSSFGEETDFGLREKIAGQIGSDVMMCLHSQPLIARGRGEQIELLDDFAALHLVLVNPGVAVATPSVFRALRKKTNAPLDPLPRQAGFSGLIGWLSSQRNDLEDAALSLHGAIRQTLEAIQSTSPLFARMSGSGATCFGIYETQAGAEQAKAAILASHPDWWVTATGTGSFGRHRAVMDEAG